MNEPNMIIVVNDPEVYRAEAEQIVVGANTGELLCYFHPQVGRPGKFDTRILFSLLHHETTYTHRDWINFIHAVESLRNTAAEFSALFDTFDIRSSLDGEEFAMLTIEQSCILLVWSQAPSSTSLLALFQFLDSFSRSRHGVIYLPGMQEFWLGTTIDKTYEEAHQKKETPLGKEKRLEREFGEKLAAQGISVQYQVRCEYGIADIVTPDAIYEIKASLSRSTLHKAIAQVLLYRTCLNPKARAVVVGYPYKNEPINFEMAKALDVEVIICEDTKE